MNTNDDFDKDDPLLNAVLGDEHWHTTNAACKAAALAAFQARQRARRAIRWVGCVAALAAALAGASYWLGRSVTPPPKMAAKPTNVPHRPPTPRYLTDAELIASFPAGACFLAEVDGKKQLVFLNPDIERQYLSKAGKPDAIGSE